MCEPNEDQEQSRQELADEVTLLLQQWSSEDKAVRSQLLTLLYPELHRLAEIRMMHERRDHTLQPTALVNEFFLRLAKNKNFKWRNREHFLAVASKAMLHLLIDYARSHNAESNGGTMLKLRLDSLDVSQSASGVDPIEIGRLLDELRTREPRLADVVELHCFGGLTFEEVGAMLHLGERTVKRDWQLARAWLRGKLRSDHGDGGLG